MAGGTSGKSVALLGVSLAKIKDASRAIQAIAQRGGVVGDPLHTVSDAAIVAAITALQAIQ